MAIEIGLHLHPHKRSAEYVDRNSRTFWTAYALEITVAFNLGRPPSVPEEHITTKFPVASSGSALAFHHVKLRQIQSKIMAKVYSFSDATNTPEERSRLCDNLQNELNKWKESLPNIYQQDSSAAYPLR
jgi:hypothetical protein